MNTVILTVVLTAFAFAHDSSAHKNGHGEAHEVQHAFKDAKKWSATFDDPARDQWQKPDFVVKNLDLSRVKCVADIGAGTGYFSTRMARSAPQATVYAVDIEPDMVEFLKERAKKENLKNHKEMQSGEEFPKIPTDCDLVLVVDTYHHLKNRSAYFKTGLLHLNKNGRVAIVDFTKESPFGPKKEHRFEKSQVVAEMQQAGYKLQKDIAGLPNQYFLIFVKP